MKRSLAPIVTAFVFIAFAICPAFAATIVSFSYLGTNGLNSQTTSIGQFTFSNAGLSLVTLSDLSSFTIEQTVNSSSGAADLLTFNVSLSNGQITGATFETKFNLQTSSPTNTLFKSQNFVVLSSTTAKTQYRDQFFPTPPPPTNDTSGPISFTTVPEPTTSAFLLGTLVLSAVSRHWRRNQMA